MKRMKKIVKKMIGENKILHYLYVVCSVNLIKMRGLRCRNYLRKNGYDVFCYSDLLEHAKCVALKKNKKDVCHVIGSGSSLNYSKGFIGENDFIIGNNFAGLCDLDFDLYFVEFGGYNVDEISRKHISIVKKYVSLKTDAVYFKNLWESKNNPEYVVANWGDNALYLKDYVVPCLSKSRLEEVLRFCLNRQNNWLPQYVSTVVTGIFVAYALGYKKIVLHGIDFGGKYFYEEGCFDGDLRLCPDVNEVNSPSCENYKKSDNKEYDFVHTTAKSDVGMKSVLPILHKILNEFGVNLYSSSDCSKSSKYLNVWDVSPKN